MKHTRSMMGNSIPSPQHPRLPGQSLSPAPARATSLSHMDSEDLLDYLVLGNPGTCAEAEEGDFENIWSVAELGPYRPPPRLSHMDTAAFSLDGDFDDSCQLMVDSMLSFDPIPSCTGKLGSQCRRCVPISPDEFIFPCLSCAPSERRSLRRRGRRTTLSRWTHQPAGC